MGSKAIPPYALGNNYVFEAYDVVGPLLKSTPVDKFIRAGGRVIGNLPDPVSLIIGTGISAFPNYARNKALCATDGQIWSDLVFDIGGSLVTDLVSSLIGVGLGVISGGFLTVPAKVISEFYLSLLFDSAVNRYNLRSKLASIFS